MKRMRSLVLAVVAVGFASFALVGRPADGTATKTEVPEKENDEAAGWHRV